MQDFIDKNFRGNIYILKDDKVIVIFQMDMQIYQMKFQIHLKQNLQVHQQEKFLSQLQFFN